MYSNLHRKHSVSMLQNCFQCCDRRDLETFPKPGNEAGAAKAAFSTGNIYRHTHTHTHTICIYMYIYIIYIYPSIYYFLYIISLAPYFLILKLTLTTSREVLLTALL